MTTSQNPRSVSALRAIIAGALTLALAWAIIGTAHWPIVGDAPLMHYVAFLMDHGMVPYRDIIDVNMPGTYALQWSVIHLLGPGAAAWRIFDIALVLTCLGSMVWITATTDWLIGYASGALFALIHLRDGPTHTGQRDLMMTTFLLLAVAFLFHLTRRARSTALTFFIAVLFGLCAGIATTIKPSAAFFILPLLIFLWLRLRANLIPRSLAVRTLLAAILGYSLPLAVMLLWLHHIGALSAFLALNRGLVAYHASLGRPSLTALIIGSFPSVLLAVALPALLLFFAGKSWRSTSAQVILTCTLLGALSYIVQGKGFPYHRYPAEAFLLLGCSILLAHGLQTIGWQRWVAATGILLGVLWLGPQSAAIASHYDWRNQEFNTALAADLNSLGGPALQNKVQCIDMTSGCLNTLYNLQLVQATGYLYDCYLFQPQQTPVSEEYRAGFWQAIQQARPSVLVVTDQQCFSMARNWDAPTHWPQFTALLQSDYTLQQQYTPPHLVAWWRKPSVPYSYRVYVRKTP